MSLPFSPPSLCEEFEPSEVINQSNSIESMRVSSKYASLCGLLQIANTVVDGGGMDNIYLHSLFHISHVYRLFTLAIKVGEP